MAVETDADRGVFVNPDDFGTAAIYTPSSAPAVTVNGIFDHDASRAFGDGGLASANPRFTCRSADLPPAARRGDRLTVEGADYTVQVIDHDGTGMTALILEEAD